ncbi:DUF2787 family protein [Alteromonas australica]|uniref:DUF2787 family protein n=1 Tax=Alteromonas australica TaxID=589873 RepID=UPI000C9917F2|nr:DUF2787 family protein [Alteromonas australica]MAD44306.1 hypothetical protein [Oceanospirillaceae bacterium]|tara:strand:- start:6006 stop:6413 length:408 start_codon:yes stop_codon:yes gene_type:complete
MRIHYDGLALPVSTKFVHEIDNLLRNNQQHSEAVTLNFRDPNYCAKRGGFHPVEIRLEQRDNMWHICYITDFAYIGSGPYAELTKELDFDFQSGVFQNLFGVFPIEQAKDMYQIWEGNFLYYLLELEAFTVSISE